MLIIVEPVVIGIEVLFPLEPDLAGAIGEQIFFLEAVREGELLGTFADEKHVVGAPTDLESDHRRVLDVFDSGNGPSLMRRAVHDAGVELHHPVLVGNAAITDGHVVGVVLDQLHAMHDGVERIAAAAEHLHCFGDSRNAVAGTDADWAAPARLGGTGLSPGEIRECGCCRRDCQKRSSIDGIHGGSVQEDH